MPRIGQGFISSLDARRGRGARVTFGQIKPVLLMKAQQDNQWSFNHNYIPISLINICEFQGPLSLLFTILLVSQHNCDPVSDDDIRVSLCYVSFVSLPHTLLYRMISRTLPGTAHCWPRSWPPCWTGSRAARARRKGEPSPWSKRSWVSFPNQIC